MANAEKVGGENRVDALMRVQMDDRDWMEVRRNGETKRIAQRVGVCVCVGNTPATKGARAIQATIQFSLTTREKRENSLIQLRRCKLYFLTISYSKTAVHLQN